MKGLTLPEAEEKAMRAVLFRAQERADYLCLEQARDAAERAAELLRAMLPAAAAWEDKDSMDQCLNRAFSEYEFQGFYNGLLLGLSLMG